MPTHIKMGRDALCNKMRDNLIKHEEEYNKAVKVWLEKIKEVKSKEHLTFLDNVNAAISELGLKGAIDPKVVANVFPRTPYLEMPVSYAKDYRNKMAMFADSADTTLELTELEYNRYVLDQWDWTASFKATTSNYLGK